MCATLTLGVNWMLGSSQEFDEKPVVLNFETSHMNIRDIPFPAINLSKHQNLNESAINEIEKSVFLL